jgi:hypothetical protein
LVEELRAVIIVPPSFVIVGSRYFRAAVAETTKQFQSPPYAPGALGQLRRREHR